MSAEYRNEITHILKRLKDRMLSLQIQLDYITDYEDLEECKAHNPFLRVTYQYLCENMPKIQAEFKLIKRNGLAADNQDSLKALYEQLLSFDETLVYQYTAKINTLLTAIKKIRHRKTTLLMSS